MKAALCISTKLAVPTTMVSMVILIISPRIPTLVHQNTQPSRTGHPDPLNSQAAAQDS